MMTSSPEGAPESPSFVRAEEAVSQLPECVLGVDTPDILSVHQTMDGVIATAQDGLGWMRRHPSSEGLETIHDALVETVDVASRCKVAWEKVDRVMCASTDPDSELCRSLDSIEDQEREAMWQGRWRELDDMVRRTFPTQIARIQGERTPWADLAIRCVKVNTWQRSQGISSAEEADRQYLAHMVSAREEALQLTERRKQSGLTAGELLHAESTNDLSMQYRGVDSASGALLEGLSGLQTAYAVMLEHVVEEELLSPRTEKSLVTFSYLSDEMRAYIHQIVRNIDMLLPGEPSEAEAQFSVLFAASIRPMIQDAVVHIADAACREIMGGVLGEFQERLAVQTTSIPIRTADIGVSGLGAIATQKKEQRQGPHEHTRPPKTEVVLPKEIGLTSDVAGWLDDEQECPVRYVAHGPNGYVVVVDAQTERMREISHESQLEPDYEERKLRHAAEMVATSKSGTITGMKTIRATLPCYRYPVRYPAKIKANAPRVYLSQIPLQAIAQTAPALYARLEKLQVHSLVVHIGSCDKAHQLEALNQLTGETRGTILARGGGSI